MRRWRAPASRRARNGAKSGGGNNAPSGLYPAKGGGPNDYVYLTTSRANPEHWSRLMKLIGREELIDDPRFATGDLRVKNEKELDAIIGEWTRQHDKREAMEKLIAVGVPSGAVFDTMELQNEPSFEERGIMQTVHHHNGDYKMATWPVRIDGKTVRLKASPALGRRQRRGAAQLARRQRRRDRGAAPRRRALVPDQASAPHATRRCSRAVHGPLPTLLGEISESHARRVRAGCPKLRCGTQENCMRLRLYENYRFVLYAPFYAAHAIGAYQAEGLEVDLLPSPGTGKAEQALIDGAVDVIWAGPMRVMKHHDDHPGSPLVCFAEIVSRDPFSIVGRYPNPDFQLADLAKMRFASLSEVPTPWLCLQEDLRQAGIDPDHLDRVGDRSMAANLAALRRGDLDAAQFFEPVVEEALATGAGHLWLAASSRGRTTYTAFVTTRDRMRTRCRAAAEHGARHLPDPAMAAREFASGDRSRYRIVLS